MLLLFLIAPLFMHAAVESAPYPANLSWIWYPEGKPAQSAPKGSRYFRNTVTFPTDSPVICAHFILNADDSAQPFVNGNALPRTTGGWLHFDTYDVTSMLRSPRTVLAVEVQNGASAAGMIGWFVIRTEKGSFVLSQTDDKWKVFNKKIAKWEQPGFDDSSWKSAMNLGPVSMGPWGSRMHYSRTPMLKPISRQKGDKVSKEKAQALIEEDWIFQADDTMTPKRALQEIQWARELADRFSASSPKLNFKSEYTELSALETRLKALPPMQEDKTTHDLYFAVRRIKRGVMLQNPLLDFNRLLLVDTPLYAGRHESSHRNGYHYGSKSGSRLLVLDGVRPDGVERELVSGDEGYIMRMDLAFDASKVIFSLKPKGERSFHLYEIGVDGQKRRQLTNSAYDDMDPIYLPDGHILFSTSRANSYVRCLPQSASSVLARCNADGGDIRIISRNNEPDYTPTLLPDGRVLYTRWEYTERPLWRLQKLWTINPDGTGLAVYWGNGSAYPDMLWEARPVPGTRKVMFAGVGHHNVLTGCLGLIDVSRGLQWPNGITKVTKELRWPEVGEPEGGSPIASPRYHSSGALWSVRCPFPLGEEDFLISAARTKVSGFSLYLMDIHGNRELIYKGQGNSWYARPLRSRTTPEAIPDRVAWPKVGEEPQKGVFVSQNVYSGVEGLPPGKVKYLRVIEMDAKTYSSGFKSWRHSGPAISIIQEDGVKRILGTVPVCVDGSVAFKIPSGKALHFQLLDDQYCCIQIMRSFTGVMPGETRGCLGCHALHSSTPEARRSSLALNRNPVDLTPPPWGAATSIGYERFCQPVLDKHCGKCHQGEGKARAKLDLTLRGGVEERGVTDPKQLPFKEPYLTLVGQAWGGPKPAGGPKALGLAGCLNVEGNHHYEPIKPMTMLSSTSRLIDLVTSGKHHNVKVEGDELRRLIAWVDCNCVYRGDEEVRLLPDPLQEIANRFPVPVKLRTAPVISRLHPVNDPPVSVAK
ncbi:MAG: hypothetical protein PF904_18210 [Kiritimatiellae bacterium]|nr:hypothetical protein [Kiritimatiellia bacterium]